VQRRKEVRKIRHDLYSEVPEILPSVRGDEDEKDMRFCILTAACSIEIYYSSTP